MARVQGVRAWGTRKQVLVGEAVGDKGTGIAVAGYTRSQANSPGK